MSRVARTSAYGPVAQEGLPGNLDRIQKSSKVLTEFKVVSAKEAKEVIQFERVDLEHVEEWAQVAFPAEIDEKSREVGCAASMKQASSTT